jgi:hypothetical protein
MLITILFPEFLFSKAVCELQMAVDDLHAMKKKESKMEWEVKFGRGLKFLHTAFHYFRKPISPDIGLHTTQQQTVVTSVEEATTHTPMIIHPTTHYYDPVVLPSEGRVWTLTHSYFANMGGFERYRDCGLSVPLTAHALVNCCVGSDHDPLPSLVLLQKDIKDKAKADWLVKSIAVTQISWLILSSILRVASQLPISQLEICTSAFAILAVATYIANWSKPKDIDAPVRFKVVADNYQCEAHKYFAESFFHLLLKPSEYLQDPRRCRIENDFVRLDGLINSMAITMAVSTLVFGGLHCLAWNFEFPTKTELMIWMVASVASATIPTFALMANMIVVTIIRRQIRRCVRTFLDRFQRLRESAEYKTPSLEVSHILQDVSDAPTRPSEVERNGQPVCVS